MEGFAELEAAFVEVGELAADPAAELFGMAQSVHELAQSNVHLYDLMFGLSIRGTHRPTPTNITDPPGRFAPCYRMMRAASGRLVGTGRLQPLSADNVAAELMSVVHEFVTLEASGHFDGHLDPAHTVLRPLCARVLVGMGDDPERATSSVDNAVRWWADRKGFGTRINLTHGAKVVRPLSDKSSRAADPAAM
ncbi:TetR-like C-terminal domain-containing protein [Gordonia polyisoprenivorans]|uniref:TetR-like C-terminal domain-containing protein n=1 Tax=Gordonia polyisoprenivorans TaxID=84595 RepID=UPI0030D24174